MPHRTDSNRLEKWLDSGRYDFESLRNIWEIELLLYEYDSDTDSEENCTTSEEEEEGSEEELESPNQEEGEAEEEEEESDKEDYGWYDWNDKENIYFTLLTGDTNSYSAGSEIFNCYGRRTNGFLLLHYGFAMLNNIYDSLTLTTEEDKPLPFKLKYNKLNEDLLIHIRGKVINARD